jgi:hypothetical protein
MRVAIADDATLFPLLLRQNVLDGQYTPRSERYDQRTSHVRLDGFQDHPESRARKRRVVGLSPQTLQQLVVSRPLLALSPLGPPIGFRSAESKTVQAHGVFRRDVHRRNADGILMLIGGSHRSAGRRPNGNCHPREAARLPSISIHGAHHIGSKVE